MTHAPTVTQPSYPLVVGDPRTWSRELALVGGVVGTLAPAFVLFDPLVASVAGVVGAVGGAGLGRVAPHVLAWCRGRLPLAYLMCLAPGAGAVWGGVAGFAGGLVHGLPIALFAGLFGAAAGGLLTGALWLPYTVQATRRASTLPVVGAALLAAPLLGWLAVLVVAFAVTLPVLGLPVLAVGAVALLFLWEAEGAARRQPQTIAPSGRK